MRSHYSPLFSLLLTFYFHFLSCFSHPSSLLFSFIFFSLVYLLNFQPCFGKNECSLIIQLKGEITSIPCLIFTSPTLLTLTLCGPYSFSFSEAYNVVPDKELSWRVRCSSPFCTATIHMFQVSVAKIVIATIFFFGKSPSSFNLVPFLFFFSSLIESKHG